MCNVDPHISVSKFSFQSKQKSAFIIRNLIPPGDEGEDYYFVVCDAV